jgi:BspA type Leucine rich repeat region (6 copies)
MTDNTAAVDVLFVYTGHGANVPRDVVRVRIDPSVFAIPADAFACIRELEEVQLHDDICQIGHRAFANCKALEDSVIPPGVREIGTWAFNCCRALNGLQLSDGVKSIGEYAFYSCNFTKFRSLPLITTIPSSMLNKCQSIFSLEVTENISQVDFFAFGRCSSLRNVALTSNTVIDQSAFRNCSDLLRIFNTEEAIADALQIRFNELPIHGSIYYKSNHNTMSSEGIKNAVIIGENGELDPTGLQQDCLGMNPLHILACLTAHCLGIYQLIIDKYPANLVVGDAGGAVPLLYAVWGMHQVRLFSSLSIAIGLSTQIMNSIGMT